MSILSNFTETVNPNNRFQFLQDPTRYEVIIGGDMYHTFTLPFNYKEVIKLGRVLYKQGLDTIIVVDILLDSMVKYDPLTNNSYITIHLSPMQSQKFTTTLLDTFCQLQLETVFGDIIFSDKYDVIVDDPISIPVNEIDN